MVSHVEKRLAVFFLFALTLVFATFQYAEQDTESKSGKALFRKHCAECHLNGGNRLYPEQTLHRKVLEANGFKTPQDIVHKMRRPGAFSPHSGKWSAMKSFDNRTLPDDEALRIAEYILKTFK